MKRRTSLLLTGSMIGGSLLGYAGLIEPQHLRMRKETLVLPNLPSAFDGFKIAQLTDFHYRPRFDQALVMESVQNAMDFQPDLIALTGDFIERSPEVLDPLLSLLSPLKAPQGVYAILGNHDYNELTTEQLKEAFSPHALKLLVNQTVSTMDHEGRCIEVIGLDSAYSSRPSYHLQTSQRENQMRLLLVHEPDVFPKCVSAYGPHLQLSGHTHGGQCRIPVLNKPLVTPHLGRIYLDGYYEQEKSGLFVSSGIGTSGLRLRFACPPEVALLTLRCA